MQDVTSHACFTIHQQRADVYSKHELSYDSWLKSMAYSLTYWYFSLADHAFWVEYL